LKRIALIASALCFALGASTSFAEQKMDKMEHTDAMQKKDGMRHSGKRDSMRHDKMDKMDKTDKVQKPGAMEAH
jgi:pentapeptide MXKDX repeat protein